jgi:hypothetical protein
MLCTYLYVNITNKITNKINNKRGREGGGGGGPHSTAATIPAAVISAFVPLRSFVPPALASCSFAPPPYMFVPPCKPLVPARARFYHPWCWLVHPRIRSHPPRSFAPPALVRTPPLRSFVPPALVCNPHAALVTCCCCCGCGCRCAYASLAPWFVCARPVLVFLCGTLPVTEQLVFYCSFCTYLSMLDSIYLQNKLIVSQLNC